MFTRLKTIKLLTLITVILNIGISNAAIYYIDPTICGRTRDGEIGLLTNQIVGDWSDGSGLENTTWLKYDIPEYPGKVIFKVLLNINPNYQYNYPYTSDIRLAYVPDDTWTTRNITSNWPVDEETMETNRLCSDTGENAYNQIKTEITSWLTFPGEGEGQTLSIRLNRIALGDRGAMMPMPQLEIHVIDMDRGHEILMEKGLQIQAQVFDYNNLNIDFDLWNISNFTGLNFQWDSTFSSDTLINLSSGAQWGRYGCWGSSLQTDELPFLQDLVSLQDGDEQDINDSVIVSQSASNLASWRSQYPKVISYSNQIPWKHTLSQLSNYMEIAKPDMLSFDSYVFTGNNFTGGSPRTLYNYMQKFRLAALSGNDGSGNAPIPYNQYIQAITMNDHVTSESELMIYYFSSWAFGYKSLKAFTYNNPSSNLQTTFFLGDDDVNPTATFYHAASANLQSKKLGPALVRLLSTDVCIVPGQHGTPPVANDLPIDINAWNSSIDPYITSITATNLGDKNGGLPGDVIVGYYKVLNEYFDGVDFTGEKYFMIVNGLVAKDGSSYDTRQNIRINFNFDSSGITSLQRLSRASGKVEVVPLVHDGGSLYHLDSVYGGGVGDLFKFNTGAPFVCAWIDDLKIGDAINFYGYSIISFDQDQNPPGTYQIQDGGDTLTLIGNAKKKIAFSYTVTSNTVIEFDYKSTQEGEFQSIGTENDSASQDGNYTLNGTQIWSLTGNSYFGSDWEHYVIRIGKQFTGNINYLLFMNTNYDGISNSNGSYRNVVVREE